MGTNAGWSGSGTTWGDSVFNLGAYAGQNIQIEIRYMTDDLTSNEGVYVDDIYATNMVTQGCDQYSDTCASAGSPGKVLNTLTVAKSGTNVLLTWTAPGGTCNTVEYGVYRGTLPLTAYNHASLSCAVTTTSYSTSAGTSSYYYLVVPQNTTNEGSYGNNSSGSQIPAASSPCHAQDTTPCN